MEGKVWKSPSQLSKTSRELTFIRLPDPHDKPILMSSQCLHDRLQVSKAGTTVFGKGAWLQRAGSISMSLPPLLLSKGRSGTCKLLRVTNMKFPISDLCS